MKIKFLVLFLFIFCLSAQFIWADRIFIQINDSLILESEYKEKLKSLEQNFSQNKNLLDSLKENLINKLINDKILEIIADRESLNIDTSILLKEVEKRIFDLKSNFKDSVEFETYLKQNGVMLKDLKENYLQQAKNIYLKRQILAKSMTKIYVNENQIKKFYEENKDSFIVKPSADIFHISFVIKPDSLRFMDLLQKFESIVFELKNGKDFSQLARDYSEDIYAKNGGNVGYKKYSDLSIELGSFLFQNKNSDTVLFTQSRNGLHIIKVLSSNDDSINFKQIFLKMPLTREDSLATYNRAKDIRKDILNNKISFENAAEKFSDDISTKDKGGFIGKVYFEMLSENLKDILANLKENEISNVVKGDFGYEIFLVKNKTGGDISPYEEVKDFIASFLENKRIEEEIEKIVNKEKSNSFIMIYSE